MTARAASALRPLPAGSLDGESSGELVRMASGGNEGAWNELVSRFGAMVHFVAKRSGLSDSDAADVGQLTWIRLMQNADRVRDPECIAAWLATTARRASLDMAIKRNRLAPSADPMEEYPSGRFVDAGVDTVVLRGEYDPCVERALRRLPAVYQRLIRLWVSDAGLTYAEIAEIMGVPVGSIGPMRLRSLRMLRRDPHFARGAAR